MIRKFKTADYLRHLGRLLDVPEARRQTPDWLALALDYARLRPLRFPFRLHLRSGEEVELLDSDSVGIVWHIFFRRCYDVKPSDRVIVDLGANIGLFALWAARRAPHARLLCLEPFPPNYAQLLQTLSLNRLTDRVVPLKMAVGNARETRSMSAGSGSSNPYVVDSEASDGKAVAVECATLEQILSAQGIDTVDFLKIDVEGAEYEALLSTSRDVLRRIRRMDIEIHKDPAGKTDRRELIAHITAAGHKLVHAAQDRYGYGVASFSRE